MKIITKATYVDIVSRFTAKEQTRPYLNSVFFEKHPQKGLTIVATNGHVMGVIYDEHGVIEVPPKQDGILLPISSAINQITRKTNFEKTFSYVNGVASVVNCAPSNHENLATFGKHHIHMEWVDHVDMKFPDWRRVLPKGKFKPVDRFSFNPKYLSMFEFKGHEGVSIFCMDEVSPSLVKIPSLPEFFGVLMPMRVGGDSKYPDWIQK